MKDFRLDRKAEPKYILDVKTQTTRETVGEEVHDIETYSVKFADGRVFKNILVDDANLQKIIAQQEKQAKAGVENIDVFVKRKKMSGIMTAASIVGGPIIYAAADIATKMDPVAIAIGTGIVTLSALIPSVCSLVKNAGKVGQLRKIEYRDKNKGELSSYTDYENSLAGLSRGTRRYFEEMAEEGQDPFCITEIDQYSLADLEQITENIKTEKTYKFTYRTTQSANK